jgi:hypothetical protein
MITIGVDAHKRVHVADAVDDAGRELGQWRGSNSAAGGTSWQSGQKTSPVNDAGVSKALGVTASTSLSSW